MYQPGFNEIEELFGTGFMALFMSIIFISIGIAIISYLLSSLGLYKIAKKMGHKSPFLAWIPIANTYLLGELAKDEIKRVKYITAPHTLYDNLGVIMVVLTVAGYVVSMIIPFLGSLISFAISIFLIVLTCISLYHIYKQFVGDSSATGFVVLYIFLAPVAMLYIASKDIVYPNAFTEEHAQMG